MPDQKNTSRGIGAIRKDLTPAVAADVKTLAKMFKRIAQHNPEAVIAAFGPFMSKRVTDDPTRAAEMVQFYADNADYIAELFDYR